MMVNGHFIIPPSITDVFAMHAEDIGSKLRVCMPGAIDTYDPAKRTATVVPSENFQLANGQIVKLTAPLVDVPVFTPQGGGVHTSFPIAPGDECLIFFADHNIDAWHAYGGQQTPTDKRQHDISDAFVVVGVNSTPNPLLTALEDSEGGLASALAKVAIDKNTQLITIAKNSETLKLIIDDIIAQIVAVNIGIIADGGVIPNAAAAATAANVQLALILARLATLLY